MAFFQWFEHQKVTFQGTYGMPFKENDSTFKVAHLYQCHPGREELFVGEGNS